MPLKTVEVANFAVHSAAVKFFTFRLQKAGLFATVYRPFSGDVASRLAIAIYVAMVTQFYMTILIVQMT